MDEALTKRIPPHSTEAEQSVIGAMITNKDAISVAAEILTAEDFYAKQYGMVFEAMVDLYDSGKSVDLVTLKERLIAMGAPDEISSLDFLRDAIAMVPSAANIRQYAKIVADKAVLRRMIKVNQELENACYNQKDDTEAILEDAEKKIFEIVQRRSAEEYTPIRTVVKEALNKIVLASKTSGVVTGIPTGFTELDYKTAGLQPSDLILIAARPSMGKTAFVLNVAQYICFHEKKSAVIFSLEMSKESLVNRLLALESHVEATSIRNGNVGAKEWESLIEGASTIGESNLIIDDTPGISIGELRSKCRKYKMDKDISIVIIDYLQLMSGNGKTDSRQQEISDISRALKALARELKVPVVALSQLSRAVEKRDDHRPMLSDLRESGAIEQDADVVMFLYREDYYKPDTDRQNVSEVIIAKQRNGPIGTVELVWLPKYTKFANMELKS